MFGKDTRLRMINGRLVLQMYITWIYVSDQQKYISYYKWETILATEDCHLLYWHRQEEPNE